MLAVSAVRIAPDDPLSGLEVRRAARAEVPAAGRPSTSRAASLNHHDLWSLRGVGLRDEQLPMILGCDAAGIDEDGNEVIVHAVISDPTGAATRRWTRAARCSPSAPGHARRAGRRPASATSCPSPPELSFEEAACLPTAWLTAYRMLFTRAGSRPATVLVQGAGGGVATALSLLGTRRRSAPCG